MSSPTKRYVTVDVLGPGVKLVSDESDKSKLYAQKEIEMKGKVSCKEDEDWFRKSVEEEVTALKRMSHSNITKYVDYYEMDGKFFIVMEVADGGDLSAAIKKRRTDQQYWKEPEIYHLFVQMCLGTQHLHKRGFIHRDIKPHNVFQTSKGVVKLGDLGAHTYIAELNQAQGFVGTPAYIAPELYQMRAYSYPCDVWSLGVVLYEMLALDLPFPEPQLYLLKDDIVNKEPDYTILEGRYSKGMVSLVKSMLKKDPAERPTIDAILGNGVVQQHKDRMVSYTCMPKKTFLLPYKPLTFWEWICGWWSRKRKAKCAYSSLRISETQQIFIEKQAAKYPASSTAWMDVYRAYQECNLEVLYETVSLTHHILTGPELEVPDDPLKVAADNDLVVKIEARIAEIKDALQVLVDRFQQKKWSVFVHE